MLTLRAIPTDLGQLAGRHGFSVRLSEDWLTLGADARPGHASPIGPWKPAARDDHDGAVRRLAFDLPVAALSGDGTACDERSSTPEALIDWAAQTLRGRTPHGWSAPAREEILEIVRAAPAAQNLSFRAGDLMEQGRIDCDGGRLAVCLTLARPGDALGAARRRWLERIIADTASLRLVRVDFAARGPGAIEATVDLTGAPAAALGTLIEAALALLGHTYTALAATLSIVGDASWPSRALEVLAALPVQPHSQE